MTPPTPCYLDVTGQVDISCHRSVEGAVLRIYAQCFPGRDLSILTRAIDDLQRLYRGGLAGFRACDMAYHDLRHVMDVSLAMARLLAGYQRCHAGAELLSFDQAVVGFVVALYHDSGYILRSNDRRRRSGGEYTRIHVSRSARFLRDYLPTIGLGSYARTAAKLVQYTGYEVDVGAIRFREKRYQRLGHLIGTADIIAQMSDRCYLDKCRDCLYPEFVLGGMLEARNPDGTIVVRFADEVDLLRKTPGFMSDALDYRLGRLFGGAYQYATVFFGGRNLYLEAIHRNRRHLENVLKTGEASRLREPFHADCVQAQ